MTTEAITTYRLFMTLTGYPTIICTSSKEEYDFCNENAATMSEATTEGDTPALYIQCVQGESSEDCAAKVASGDAHLLTGVDGGKLYDYYTSEDLQL